jgi:MFS family permease
MTAIGAHGVAIFRHRDFALIWGATFLASVAMQMMAVAVGWQMYDLTGRAFDLGLVGLAEFLPSILLVFLTGAAADRFDRRIVTILAMAGEFLCAAALLWFAWTMTADRWSILAIAAGFGISRAFAAPAARALIPALVPAAELPGAIAWSALSWQGAIVGGPAIGGFLYAWGGPELVYASAGGMLLIGASAMACIRRPLQALQVAGESTFNKVVAGLRLIFQRKILLGAISLDLFAVLFSSAIALLPVFAKDVLQVGPDGLGILRASPGLGAVIMGVVLTQFPLRNSVGKLLFLGVGVFGLCAVAFSLSTFFWLSVALLVVMGAGDMLSVYIRGTIVPLATPDRLRGRVMAVEMVFIGASNELGAFAAGVFASILGAVGAVTFGGTATLLVVLLWMKFFPQLTRIQRLDADELGFREDEGPDKLPPAQETGDRPARDGG